MNIYESWLEIDLKKIAHNARLIKSLIDKDTKILAMIKANAYGHGYMEVADILVKESYDYLGINNIEEGVSLKKKYPQTGVMNFSHANPLLFEKIVEFEVEQMIASLDEAKKFNETGKKLNKKAKVHINIDTGMGRTGFMPNETGFNEIIEVSKLENIKIKGIMTHLSSAEMPESDYSLLQLEKFRKALDTLENMGMKLPLVHAVNSAGMLKHKDSHFNMVRVGTNVYGQFPEYTPEWKEQDLRLALSMKARVANVRVLPKGSFIGYDRTYQSDKEIKVATLNLGYYEGLSNKISKDYKASINGNRVPIIGLICMNNCMLDVTGVDVKIGDEVLFFGENDFDKIDIQEMADGLKIGTALLGIHLGNSMPKIYLK